MNNKIDMNSKVDMNSKIDMNSKEERLWAHYEWAIEHSIRRSTKIIAQMKLTDFYGLNEIYV